MPVKIRQGGVWNEPSVCKVFKGGVWRNIAQIQVYKGGAWRIVGNFTTPPSGGGGGGSSGAITLTASPSVVAKEGANSTLTTQIITATPSGGLAPYTYVWSIVTSLGGFSYTINSPSLASTTVTASGLALDDTATASIRCVVTDALGTTATSNTVPISWTRIQAHDPGN